MVVDGVNGLVVPPDSPEAIADALSRLYADRDLAARLGATGRERAVASLTWAHFGRRLLEAYQVVGQGATGRR